MTHPLDLPTMAGPVVVTLAYVLLYYGMMIRVAQVKIRLAKEHAARGEKFDRYYGQDRQMLAADRAQLNMLEHMPPFLVLLWLDAVFVGPFGATVAGAVYLCSRLLYPVLLGARLGRGLQAKVYLATAPGYLVLAWFLGALVYALVTG